MKVRPITVFLSFLVGMIIIGLLSFTCSFLNSFALGFFIPIQGIAYLVTGGTYQINTFTTGWECIGFFLGIYALLDSVRRKGVLIITTYDCIEGEKRIL